MVLGADIGLEDTCRLALCGLVGRFSYHRMSDEKLSAWLEKIWCPVIGYVPELFMLSKGWIGFLCRNPEDATLLLNSYWVDGTSSLMLKRWRLAFNPETDFFPHRHIWVFLPGLPWFLWNVGALKAIGNSLGKFIMTDEGNLSASARKVGKVMVEIDVQHGLPATLEIEWRGSFILQKLDYLGVPFVVAL
jgi:hypothetical protein